MARRRLGPLALFVLCCAAATPSLGGQVVTDDARAWAREAAGEEQALAALEGRNTLAVLYFRNGTGRPELDPLQKGLALMLTTDLSAVEGLQVVERVRLQALAEETGLGTSGLVAPDTAPRVGRLLGARWLVGGDLLAGALPEALAVRSRVLDVPKEDVVGQPAAEGALADLFRLEKALLFDIVETLKIEVGPEERVRLAKPCSRSLDAMLALFQGVEASDRGDYKTSAAFYEKALSVDPGICVAGDALKELRTLGLVPRAAGARDLLRSLKDQTSLTDQLTPEDPVRRITPPALIPGRGEFGFIDNRLNAR